jgi:hypothetical protein
LLKLRPIVDVWKLSSGDFGEQRPAECACNLLTREEIAQIIGLIFKLARALSKTKFVDKDIDRLFRLGRRLQSETDQSNQNVVHLRVSIGNGRVVRLG